MVMSSAVDVDSMSTNVNIGSWLHQACTCRSIHRHIHICSLVISNRQAASARLRLPRTGPHQASI